MRGELPAMRSSVAQGAAAPDDHPLLPRACRAGQTLAPPSTYSVWPVMNDASSLHRNAAVAAMSSG